MDFKEPKIMKILLMMITVLITPFVFASDAFVSTPFRLDMRMDEGVRVAEPTEIIYANAEWADGDVAIVMHTPPGGEPSTLHTTTSMGAESFVWDALHSVAGEHLFTHTVRRGGNIVDTLSVTFTVPEPTLNAVRIFGPSELYSGNAAQYVCMGYFSDDSGREVVPEWSIVESVSGISVDQNGCLLAEQSTSDQSVTLRAVATLNGNVTTNELEVAVLAAYLTVKPTALSVTKTVGEYTVSVACSGAWTAESNADWIKLLKSSGEGDGLLGFDVERNPETSTRKGTVSFKCGTLSAKLTVKQAAGDAIVKVMVAFDAQGGSANYTSHEYIVGEKYGTLPYATKSGKVFGGWWTLPLGQGVRVIATSDVTDSVTKLYAYWRDATTADALDGALDWTDDGNAVWSIDSTTSKSGSTSMRSGAIGDNESTVLMTEVTGPGTLSFWWRSSCEEYFDQLMLFDGMSDNEDDAVMSISGETAWEHRTYSIADSGTHVIRWVFRKDEFDGAGRDCAWLDGVVWMPAFAPDEMTGESTGEHIVPMAWKNHYGITSANPDSDSDGDGMSDWEEYVAGSNPSDPGSKFTLNISMENGTPELQPTPYLGGQREYIIEGKENLADKDWVSPIKPSHRFFRAKVNMK